VGAPHPMSRKPHRSMDCEGATARICVIGDGSTCDIWVTTYGSDGHLTLAIGFVFRIHPPHRLPPTKIECLHHWSGPGRFGAVDQRIAVDIRTVFPLACSLCIGQPRYRTSWRFM
jgi:hypothetical protein